MKREEDGSHFKHKVTGKWQIIVYLSGAMFFLKHSTLRKQSHFLMGYGDGRDISHMSEKAIAPRIGRQ